MKRYIRSSAVTAADDADNGLDDLISDVKDDFDYILGGIETLSRYGGESAKSAMSIASNLRVALGDYIAQIADTLTER